MPSTWFHLSRHPDAEALAISTSEGANVLIPSVPRDADGKVYEIDLPRICVAKNIWRCLIAIPGKTPKEDLHTRYIYKLTLPVQPKPAEDCVLDREHTGEHWILDDLIEANLANIEVQRLGMIPSLGDQWNNLNARYRLAHTEFYLEKLVRHHAEERAIWKIDENEWRLDFDLLLDEPTPSLATLMEGINVRCAANAPLE